MEFASWNIPASASSSASVGRKGATEYQLLRNGGGSRKRSAGSVPPLDEDTLEELDLMPTKVRRTHMELVSARDHIASLEQQLSARDAVIDILVSQLRGGSGSGGAATSSSAYSAYGGGRDTVGTSLKYPNLQVRADPIIPGAPIQVPFFNTTVDTDLAPVQFTNYVAPNSSARDVDPKTKPGSTSPVVDPCAALPSTASPDLAIANAVLRAVKPSAAPTTLLSTVAATAKPAAAVAAAAPKATKAAVVAPPAVVKPKPAAAPAPTLVLQHPTLLKQQQKNAPPPPPPAPPVVVDASGVDDELEEYAEEEEAAVAEEPPAAEEEEEEEEAAVAEEEEEEDEDPVYVQVKVSAKKPPMGFFMMPSTGYLHRVAKDEDGDAALGELVAKYNPVTKTIIEQYVPQL